LYDSSLQPKFNKEGFNVKSSKEDREASSARIGIISNGQDDCETCESRIGLVLLGREVGQPDDNSCGNKAGHKTADNNKQHTKYTKV